MQKAPLREGKRPPGCMGKSDSQSQLSIREPSLVCTKGPSPCVLVGVRIAALGNAFQPAALGPGEIGIDRIVEPVAWVPGRRIGNIVVHSVQAYSGQQVCPGRIAVGIGNDVTAAADRAEITRRFYCIIDEGTLGTVLRLSYNSHYSIREPSPD